jgi:signal transduction histidine kinase/response regulator RpfG family c-di-GMP phosphodiesterase
MTAGTALSWALAAAALLLLESVRRRRSAVQEAGRLRGSMAAAVQRNEQLSQAAEEMGRLYRDQLLTSRQRATRLQKVLEIATSISSNLTLDRVLHEIVHAVADAVGFRIVLLRVRNARGDAYDARAFAGLERDAIAALEDYVVPAPEFESWLREEFRIGRSYFISHERKFWGENDPHSWTPDLGERRAGEWHQDDVLIVPLRGKDGGVIGYLSVDDPVDRKVPSPEVVEMIEILATHAVVALQNASLVERLHESMGRLEEATQRAEELNEMKSKFVSTVSHELKTPLTHIHAYVEALQQHVGSKNVAMQRDFLNVIDEHTGKLTRLIEAILELTQLESGRFRMSREPLNLIDLVEEEIGILKPQAESKGVQVVAAIDVSEVILEADRGLLRRLLHNLGLNAVMFTPRRGVVTFRVVREGRTVRLTVEDTGVGIPNGELSKVFDRFHQVDGSLSREYPGVGLGLSIAKSIVEWHGGEISAESEPGRGSRFNVSLPATPSDANVITHATWSPTRSVSDHLTRLTVEMVAEVMNAQIASLMLVDEEHEELYIKAARGLREEVVSGTRIRMGDSIAGWVAKHGRPLLITNIEDDARFGRRNHNQYETKSLLSVPVKVGDRVVGVININNKISCAPFTEDDEALLTSLAGRVARAWEHASAHEETADRAEQASRALAAIIDHTRRSRLCLTAGTMAERAAAVGRKLGMSEEEISVLAYAARIHDVGMAHVSPGILHEPGQLDPDAWAHVAEHPARAVELLKPIEFHSQVTEIILAHHERIDGRGYPRGLRGEQIPLGARIIAAVDAYESMTLGRPYRQPMSHEDAVAELQSHRGTQFDEGVVDAFVEVMTTQQDIPPFPTPEAAESGR